MRAAQAVGPGVCASCWRGFRLEA